MVYTASSLSLATLELLVHVEDVATIYNLFWAIPITFDESIVQELNLARLPKHCKAAAPIPETQFLGDNWIKVGSSAILKVPSAVTSLGDKLSH